MSSDKICFAQVDAHLDTNPKIRKAGSVFATAVFEFILRRNALMRREGSVPINCIDPEYLRDMLMMTCDEARHGTSRAVTADLIKIDEEAGLVYIVGWTAEWGRRPKDGSQRTKSWRERQSSKSSKGQQADHTIGDESDGCDERASRVTVGDESDALDQSRSDKKREEDLSGKPDGAVSISPAQILAETAVFHINAAARTSYRASSKSTTRLCNALIRAKHTPDEVRRVVDAKRHWLGEPKMKAHFVPGTLLALANFEKYLDEIEGQKRPAAVPANDEVDDFELMPMSSLGMS